jgi:hypothetical protein
VENCDSRDVDFAWRRIGARFGSSHGKESFGYGPEKKKPLTRIRADDADRAKAILFQCVFIGLRVKKALKRSFFCFIRSHPLLSASKKGL